MHILILSLFVTAALLGLFLLSRLALKKPLPKSVAIAHGIVAASGLISLVLYTLEHPDLLTTLLVLGGAALGGIYMLVTHRSGKKLPQFIPFVHGSVGIIGLILLIYYFYG